MVLTVPVNTYAALQNARNKPLIYRDLVWFKAKNRDTGALEAAGVWSGAVAQTIDVIRPSDGAISNRVYQPNVGLMKLPSIPMSMKLEDRRIRLTFSRLTPAIVNAVLVFDIKDEPIEIHRIFLDPDTMLQIDPAICRYDGFVRRASVKRAKMGNDGQVTIEAVGHSASLRPNPEKLSDEFFRRRRAGDHSGQYLNSTPKIVWGQEVVVKERKRRPREKFFK